MNYIIELIVLTHVSIAKIAVVTFKQVSEIRLNLHVANMSSVQAITAISTTALRAAV